jgi:hypothetical protein
VTFLLDRAPTCARATAPQTALHHAAMGGNLAIVSC